MLKSSLLWKFYKEPDCASYLFGTMHVKNKIAYLHLDKAYEALYRCDAFKAEIDLDEAQESIDITDYQMPNAMTLQDLVNVKKYFKMKKIILKAFSVNLDLLVSFYPLIISSKLVEGILNNDKSLSLDAHLWDKAKSLNMNLGGVESVSSQIEIMKNLDISIQLKQLKELTKNVRKFKRSTLRMLDHYADENIALLFKESKKSMGSLRKLLIYDRNESMAKTIAMNENQKCFYGIGAAHLAGKKGVLNLLKQYGFKLEAIH